MRKGDKGSNVLALQQSLNKLGKARGGTLAKTPLIEDGIFGALTDVAARDFQRSAGLAVDGVVGYATLDALKKALAAVGAGPQPDPAKVPTDSDTNPRRTTASPAGGEPAATVSSGGSGGGSDGGSGLLLLAAGLGIAGLVYLSKKKGDSAVPA